MMLYCLDDSTKKSQQMQRGASLKAARFFSDRKHQMFFQSTHRLPVLGLRDERLSHSESESASLQAIRGTS